MERRVTVRIRKTSFNRFRSRGPGPQTNGHGRPCPSREAAEWVGRIVPPILMPNSKRGERSGGAAPFFLDCMTESPNIFVLICCLGIAACTGPGARPPAAVEEPPIAGDIRDSRESGAAVPTGWLYFIGDGFALPYPPEADWSREGETMTRFRVIGPGSEPNTEITDGFTFTIGRRALGAGQTGVDYARRDMERSADVGEILDPIEPERFRGRTAYAYRARTLGEVTNLIVDYAAREGETPSVIHLAWNVADPFRHGYPETVELMLEGLEIGPDAGANAAPDVVEVAFLDPDGVHEGSPRAGPSRGCDTVVWTRIAAVDASGPAETALRSLFADDRVRTDDGLYNFIARTNDTLRVESVTVTGATARVDLSGEVTNLGGVCDDPRARTQIEETLARMGIRRTEIFLDGEPTDLLPDDGRGAGPGRSRGELTVPPRGPGLRGARRRVLGPSGNASKDPFRYTSE